MSDTEDDVKISDQLISLLVKEHNFKKRLLFANISLIMDMMVDEASIQMLTPTLKDLITVGLKNDEIIIKLIDTLKKYDDKKVKSFSSSDDEDGSSDELLDLINMKSDEYKELNEKVKQKEEDNPLEDKVDNLIDKSKIKDELN